MHVWLELGTSGIFTPTAASPTAWLPWQVLTEGLNVESLLNEVADRGYFAIRLPDLDGQTSAIVSPTVRLNYYSPPDSTTRTTVPVTVTRLVSYEAQLTSRFGTDGQSHWEAWWLPPGQRFPLPTSPARFEDEFPAPLALEFSIDFGPGTNSRDVIGRNMPWAMYTGYSFIGPNDKIISSEEWPIPSVGPQAAFGARCEYVGLGSRTLVQEIRAGVPFSHSFCLENYDTVARSFTIEASSSQDWAYAYSYRTLTQTVEANTLPFTVTASPATSAWPNAGILNVVAVYTPALASTDTFRETLLVTATSVISPSVQARDFSFALAPGYELSLDVNNEGNAFKLFLPVILKPN